MSMVALALTIVLAVATAAFYIAGHYAGGNPMGARHVLAVARPLL